MTSYLLLPLFGMHHAKIIFMQSACNRSYLHKGLKACKDKREKLLPLRVLMCTKDESKRAFNKNNKNKKKKKRRPKIELWVRDVF